MALRHEERFASVFGRSHGRHSGLSVVNPDQRNNALVASVRTRRKQIEQSEQGVYLPKKLHFGSEAAEPKNN